MEKCVRCNKEKKEDEFIDAKGVKRKQCADCRFKSSAVTEDKLEKKRAQAKAWRDKNKERVRLYNEHQRKLANGEESVWEEIKEEKNIENNVVGKPSPHRKLHTFVNGIEGKPCSKCKTWKSLESFNNLKSSWDGLRTECKDCLHLYRVGNKENMTEYNKEYWIKTKERQTERHKIWKDNNKEHLQNYYKNKRKNDIQFAIGDNLRYQVRRYIKNINHINDYIKISSCTVGELRKHLEKSFSSKMSWDNYGTYWHIDHIVPCKAWDLTDDSQVSLCFHYTNLQPLAASDNFSKSANYTESDKNKCQAKIENLNKKYSKEDKLFNYMELNDYVVTNGYILLSNIDDLINSTSELDVFCTCGYVFTMCMLDINKKFCLNCINKSQEQDEEDINDDDINDNDINDNDINDNDINDNDEDDNDNDNDINDNDEDDNDNDINDDDEDDNEEEYNKEDKNEIRKKKISEKMKKYNASNEGKQQKIKSIEKCVETKKNTREEIRKNLEEKICSKCRETLSIEMFCKKADTKDGYQPYCKGCINSIKIAKRSVEI